MPRIVLALLPFLTLAGCIGAPVLNPARLVDLSHPYDQGTISWPGGPGFEREGEQGDDAQGRWYATGRFSASEHGGTHLDAPIHFGKGREPADRILLDRLIVPAVVIDVSEKAVADRDYRLTVDGVRAWEKANGRIPAGSAVLLRTGWGPRWPDRRSYFGDDTPGRTTDLHFPGFGAEAAALLVRERGIAALGLDTPSLDHGPTTDFPVHQIVAAANVPGFENLANLEQLPQSGWWLVALPVKIGGGSGGPLRAVALLP